MPEPAELVEPAERAIAAPADPPDGAAAHAAWLDDLTYSSLQLIGEALVELAGFGVAAISVAREDGRLHMAVVCGNDDARAQLVDHSTPIDALRAELDQGDRWGRFTFVPHERLGGDYLPGWVGDYPVLEGEDAWHPEDHLVALLHDAEGRLRASLAIDVPDDGRRPGAARRATLERFAAQAERAVVSALERARLADRVRLADAARVVIRQAASSPDLSSMLDRAGDALLASTGSTALWMRAFSDDERSRLVVARRADGTPLPHGSDSAGLAHRAAANLWRHQRAGVRYAVEIDERPDDADNRIIRPYLEAADGGSMLLVPLGVGDEAVGSLTLVRSRSAPPWTQDEMDHAFGLSSDLGQLLLNAVALQREQRLATELQELDDYKNALISTVTQELRLPLTSIAGRLEELGRRDLGDDGVRALDAMERASDRMVRLVEDLVLLARVQGATGASARPVDLVPIVREVGDLTAVTARDRSLDLRIRVPAFSPVLASGDPVELDRVVVNLVSNAVKYTLPGGAITVSTRRVDEIDGSPGGPGGGMVELVVADDGIGISEEDQRSLFTEFFRSTNPVALAEPGTGLGLAIVDRVVRRHGGRIEVDSELGVGTTIRVLLPAAHEEDR